MYSTWWKPDGTESSMKTDHEALSRDADTHKSIQSNEDKLRPLDLETIMSSKSAVKFWYLHRPKTMAFVHRTAVTIQSLGRSFAVRRLIERHGINYTVGILKEDAKKKEEERWNELSDEQKKKEKEEEEKLMKRRMEHKRMKRELLGMENEHNISSEENKQFMIIKAKEEEEARLKKIQLAKEAEENRLKKIQLAKEAEEDRLKKIQLAKEAEQDQLRKKAQEEEAIKLKNIQLAEEAEAARLKQEQIVKEISEIPQSEHNVKKVDESQYAAVNAKSMKDDDFEAQLASIRAEVDEGSASGSESEVEHSSNSVINHEEAIKKAELLAERAANDAQAAKVAMVNAKKEEAYNNSYGLNVPVITTEGKGTITKYDKETGIYSIDVETINSCVECDTDELELDNDRILSPQTVVHTPFGLGEVIGMDPHIGCYAIRTDAGVDHDENIAYIQIPHVRVAERKETSASVQIDEHHVKTEIPDEINIISAQVVDHRIVARTGKKFVQYKLAIHTNNYGTLYCYKRYSTFRNLCDRLVKDKGFKRKDLPELPSRHILGNFTNKVINERSLKLNNFLNAAIKSKDLQWGIRIDDQISVFKRRIKNKKNKSESESKFSSSSTVNNQNKNQVEQHQHPVLSY